MDLDRDGHAGTPEDRSLCAFFVIRVSECNPAYTSGYPLWFEYYVAARRVLDNGWACLQVHYGGYGEIRRWTAAPCLRRGGCRMRRRL